MKYTAPRWLPSGHLQTIYPATCIAKPAVAFRRERWDTPDGDFVDVDFVDGQPGLPMVVLFHGLEGSSDSHYSRALMAALARRGWSGVIPHFRGCSGEMNLAPRFYHSGDAQEIDWVARRLRARHTGPLFAAGVSLGGNALLRWLGESQHQAEIIDAAVAVSAPLDLAAGGKALSSGFNLIYTRVFLQTLKPKCLRKLEQFPGKGKVLNQMSDFWFEHLKDIVPNHLTGIAPESVVKPEEVEQVRGRAVVAKRLKPILVEAVVRGYLIGSGWKDYQDTGAVCGIALPVGLRQADKLATPIFTPAAKADLGEHDENISFEEMEQRIGKDLAEQIRKVSIKLYENAADYAATRGIIIADTKFEFGLDDNGVLHLMDEVLTADSSRFWPADSYAPGMSPPSFDKQFVRDYLETLKDWKKTPPAPKLPEDVIARTGAKYREALQRLTGRDLVE